MTKRLFIFISILAVGLLIISGCSREAKITKLVNIKKFEISPKKRLDKILVVGKPIMEKNRNDFEKYFSGRLNSRKTDAVPSYKVIPEMKNLSRDNIKEAAVKMSAEAVLATRVVGVDKKSVLIPQQMKVQIDDIATPGGMVMTMSPFIEGPNVKNYTNVRLETGLFETKTEKMIWSASSKIIAPDSVDEAIKDFSKAILMQLRIDGYVR